MSAILTPIPPHFALADLAGTRRFSVDEYHHLATCGILTEDDPVELLDGYITWKLDSIDLPVAAGPFPSWWALRRWTPDEYRRMIRAGILAEGEPVELLDGYLVKKMSRGPAHDCAIDLFRNAVAGLLPIGTLLRSQQAIGLTGTEPEPDFAVVVGTARDFARRHPIASEIRLLIEVSDSSLALDRGPKAELYARDGIVNYWIINIPMGQVEIYTNPDTFTPFPTFTKSTIYGMADSVPVVIDGVVVGAIPVASLIP